MKVPVFSSATIVFSSKMSVLRINAALIFFVISYVQGSIPTTERIVNHNRRRHSQNIQEDASSAGSSWNNPDNSIDYRLTRLEVEVREKSESIRAELRETNDRLQQLEWQNSEARSALEGVKAELQRFSQQQQHNHNQQATYAPIRKENNKLEARILTLTKAIQIVIATTRSLNTDVLEIRNNISQIVNRTEKIFQANRELLTKQIFNNGLLELKTHPIMYASCPALAVSNSTLPKSCLDVRLTHNQSGVYRIQPEHSTKSLMVYCDMETRGGGWTVLQNRANGLQDFYLNWHDYKHGFGNLGGEFWLGLENMFILTGYDVNELLIELEDFNLQKAYARYGAFSIGPEVEGFPLKVLGGYSGDAGDSLIYHAGSRFSTKDMDQDSWPEGSCAQAHGGGWWYRSCDASNLNGRYLSGELPEQYIYQGMYWGEFKGSQYSLFKARMLVRPRDRDSPPMFVADNTRNTTLWQH